MERHCKNCHSQIYANKNYCADCGAKWIDNRVTMRNVANDFSDMYLGWDNKFLITFLDLFVQPENVINGYINGRRGKYLEAVRYILLAVFVSGIYILVLKKTDPTLEFMDYSEAYREFGYTDAMIAQVKSMNEAWGAFVMDYQGVIILASIPLYAIFARITFWKQSKYYNYTEHIVFFLYVFGQASIISSIICLVILLINPSYFSYWLTAFVALQIFYTAYCYKRSFKLSLKEILTKTIKFVFVMLGIYLALIIVGIIVGILLKIAGVF